jgi:preprotein translocase SecE subunit
MATAVRPTPVAQSPNPRLRLAVASLTGALVVAAGVAAAAYAVPTLLAGVGGTAGVALRWATQLATVAGFVWVGSTLAGANPPRGIRGGIFLAISALITVFFVTRAVGLNFAESAVGVPLTVAVLAGLLYGTYWLLTSSQAQGWMAALEDHGWFHTFSYKRNQGQKVRRYTLIGFLLIGWSGVYSIFVHDAVGKGAWTLALPFTEFKPTVLTDVEFTVPILLAVAAFWVAWRAVNMPAFADFLIATEAELNKVSWPTRKGLIQDTVVVLATTVLLTMFLLVVDWFWGTLLSSRYIAVLPPSESRAADNPNVPQGPGW